RGTLKTHQICTIVLLTNNGSGLRVRKASRPELVQGLDKQRGPKAPQWRASPARVGRRPAQCRRLSATACNVGACPIADPCPGACACAAVVDPPRAPLRAHHPAELSAAASWSRLGRRLHRLRGPPRLCRGPAARRHWPVLPRRQAALRRGTLACNGRL